MATRQCLATGLTKRQLDTRVDRKEFERVARGVYDTGLVLPGSLHDQYEIHRRRTACLGPLSRPGTVAVGVAALVLHGVLGAPVRFTPEVAAVRARPRRDDGGPVRVRRVLVPRPVEVDGLLVAPVVDSLALAVPALPLLEAVTMIDSARHLGLVDDDGVRQARVLATGRRGARRAASWWELSDPRAESPAESWARITCRIAGVPPDAVQLCLVDAAGRALARVDLAWLLPGGGLLVVEIDGRDVHSAPSAVYADRHRQNRISGPRTVVRRFTGSEARDGTAARQVAELLRRVGWTPNPVPDDATYCIERARWVRHPQI